MRIHKAHVLVIVFGRYWILQLIDLTRRNLTKPPAKRKMLIYSRLPFLFPRHNTSPQQSVCTLMPHWCNCACLSCRALESPTPTPPPRPRSPWHPSALAQMLCSEVAAFQMISAMRNTENFALRFFGRKMISSRCWKKGGWTKIKPACFTYIRDGFRKTN